MPRPSISELADSLVASCGEVVGEIQAHAGARWALVRVASQPDPVKVSVDIRGLEQRLDRAVAGGARDGFPDVDARTAARRLASVNLDEEIDSAHAVVYEAGLDRQGRTWRRTGEPVDPPADLPPGDYRWSARTRTTPPSP
ncbi:hypothetical protein GCM10023221_28450 [Luteimicrobium xylanilyticum]|uniref:Uncharacterized protein n=1 Tax=Luteimicrobium xylanilyticum TaxID=1133546 RepID=A0A5P9QB18_9MICO|nr:hypothetical protein [Luteimicrobium xylanilyticum]QFU98627.1 hypothetical protein KDY119_02144 [Luteimicrobium xylanilyticum]